MKRQNWIILTVLVVAMLLLAGCGVPREGVDVTTVQPDGPWQTFVVWPLANILVWMDAWLAKLGVLYHWGWAIILFTMLVKLLTFPLTLQQTKGMQAQKELQPRVQELQKKYGKDREKLAQEQMKLYQEAGVNPLGGCLPLVIQMPILFGLYSALVAIGPFMENARFFWIPNLNYPNLAMSTGLIPQWITVFWQEGNYLTLFAYLVLPILLVVTQFVMQKWMTPTPAGAEDSMKMTQNMSMIMTLMFGYFTLQVPAGLTLYWVTSNVLQMVQQWSVTRYFVRSKPTPATVAVSSGANPVTVDAKASTPTATSKSTATKGATKSNSKAKGK
ncbi:MAG: membrane protein insertase YidC [Anaerolineales bacterium]|nr:membrane protein insertase YidC [Anaerolineales bacterium]